MEACEPTDCFYNTEKLAGSGQIDIPEAPAALANAIRDHYWNVKYLESEV